MSIKHAEIAGHELDEIHIAYRRLVSTIYYMRGYDEHEVPNWRRIGNHIGDVMDMGGDMFRQPQWIHTIVKYKLPEKTFEERYYRRLEKGGKDINLRSWAMGLRPDKLDTFDFVRH